jgi:hypothetical protein
MKLTIKLKSLSHERPVIYSIESDGVFGYHWRSFTRAYLRYEAERVSEIARIKKSNETYMEDCE